MEDLFRFDISLLNKTLVEEPPVIPADAEVRLVIDPSYSAKEAGGHRHRGSDKTGILAFYRSTEDGIPQIHIVDGDSQRYEGGDLPRAIYRFARTHNPSRIFVEDFGIGAFPLLRDFILMLAQQDGLSLSIEGFFPNNRNRAKPRRIKQIHDDLLICDPPPLRIYGMRLWGLIAEQARDFLFEEDDNRGREDGLLDCLSLIVTRGL